MTYVPSGSKAALMSSKRQLATVIDLNKCMGCQTCTVACKNLWTMRDGTKHMRWMNVTTYPGKGYPRDYEQKGGGYNNGRPQQGTLPDMTDCGDHWTLNQEEVFYQGKGQSVHLKPTDSFGKDPDWGYNWDEDEGGGQWPSPYFFYLPRNCNHCSNPPCVAACPRNAVYKREEDGIVLIDQERCDGHRYCVAACPYKAIYFNPVSEKSEKCHLCYPRIEQGIANACNRQCVGRTRALGFLDDQDSQVYQLVKKWKVALPLHPEYGTEPNVYYVPPLSPRGFNESGKITNAMRIPIEMLEGLFGPEVRSALATIVAERKKKIEGKGSELMDILISRVWSDRFAQFTKEPV